MSVFRKIYQNLKAMSPKLSTLELLRAKDCYNRISLRNTWAHGANAEVQIKFDRLKLDYGDSRVDYINEKRRNLSEGLKISK